MIKSTIELQQGDRIILPARGFGSQPETVKVHAVRKYIPGIMEVHAREAGHDRVIFFERAPRPGQDEGIRSDITVSSGAEWTLA
jgi:hypothetical protein